MLLIDDGLIVSLDFSGTIYQKNAGATFYRDKFNVWKTTILFINCFSLFLYFLDWNIVDKISMDIKNFIVEHFPLLNDQIWGNENYNNSRIENNWLQLSNSQLSISNVSIQSINSNEESSNIEDENSYSNNNININNNNNNNNLIRLSRRRNFFEDDVFERIPCI